MIIYSIGRRFKNIVKIMIRNFDHTTQSKDVDLYEYNISKDTSKDGVYVLRFENGNIKAELFYKDSKLNGICNFYYENGRIKAREEYRDGFLEGTCKKYYPFGILQSEEIYDKGKLIHLKEFNDEGRLIKETKLK